MCTHGSVRWEVRGEQRDLLQRNLHPHVILCLCDVTINFYNNMYVAKMTQATCIDFTELNMVHNLFCVTGEAIEVCLLHTVMKTH